MDNRVITPISYEADHCWIPVSDCLPEPLHDVLASRIEDGEPVIDMAYRRKNGEWVLTGSDPDIIINPTHWMALPKAPGVTADKVEQVFTP